MSDANLIRERNDAVAKATALESELFALGIQVEALKERLKLASGVVQDARIAVSSAGAFAGATETVWALERLRRALSAFDAVPGDVAPRVVGTIGGVPVVEDASLPDGYVMDGGPRYASGEVPMVGDVFRFDRNESYMTVDGIDDGGFVWSKGGLYWSASKCALVRRARLIDMEVVRRAAPPASDLLARAVALLREHAYDVRVIDFLADFDKGGV
jgi:hypothetical protein